MTTPVKYFHSEMRGAPARTGTAGSLISVLDACLVTGFGLLTVDALAVSNGVATMTINAASNAFELDSVAMVSGATPAALNGERRVAAVTGNKISYAAPGVPDGVATGTITVKMAPAGWEKPFQGANLAAYRSADVTGTRMYLRVDDSSPTNARVVGYESMTDIVSGVGPFPAAGQQQGGGWWPKAIAPGTGALAWTLVADSRSFLLHLHTALSNPGASGAVWMFGDFESLRSGDPYSCALIANGSDAASSSGVLASAVEYLSAAQGDRAFMPRSFTGLGGSVNGGQGLEAYASGTYGAAGALASPAVPNYPNGPNNALVLSRKVLIEPGVALRGRLRGVHLPVQQCHDAFSWLGKENGQDGLLGRKLLAIKCGGPAGTTSQGLIFVDITGPWESA